jgi:hypothetical protein
VYLRRLIAAGVEIARDGAANVGLAVPLSPWRALM